MAFHPLGMSHCPCLPLQRLTCFPATQAAGRSVLEKVALIRDNDSRDDLKNAAKMYAGSLERLLPKLKDAGEKAPTPAPAAAPVVVLAPEKVPPPALPWYCLLVQMLCLFVVQASAGERRGGGREPEKPKAREPSPAAPAPAKPPAASTPKPSAVKVRVYFHSLVLPCLKQK